MPKKRRDHHDDPREPRPGRKTTDAARLHLGWTRSDLPPGARQPVWQYQDPRDTRAFYEGRVRAYAAAHGYGDTPAGRDRARHNPEFRHAWMIYKRNVAYENEQNQAARDYILAERYRAGKLTHEQYRTELAVGRDLGKRDDRRDYYRWLGTPMTRRQYEDKLLSTTVPRGRDSEYARILVTLGLRTPADTWDVGDTP